MARKSAKKTSPLLLAFLMAGVIWTYFQPVFEIQISGFAARNWSAWELTQSGYQAVSRFLPQFRKKPAVKIEIHTGFSDFLKQLFPRRSQPGFQPTWQQWAGFLLGILIPVALAAAYLCLFLGIPVLLLNQKSFLARLARTAFLTSGYALLGVIYLGHEARLLFEQSVDQASRGLFGLFAKSLIPAMSLHPGVALYSLPALAVLIWVMARGKR